MLPSNHMLNNEHPILKRKVMVPNDGQCLRVCAGYKAIIISSRARGSLKLSNIS